MAARCGLAAAALWFCVTAVGAEDALNAAPADVDLAVLLLQVDVEALRWATQGPEFDQPPWVVGEAAPRHVLWPAQLLLQRANWLASQTAAPQAADAWRLFQPGAVPEGREITDADVLALVRDAHARIRATLERRNINVAVDDLPRRGVAQSRGDALRRILQASGQIDRMLGREASLRDVYNRLAQAVDRAGDLLNGRYPTLPALMQEAQALNVFQRLLACLSALQAVQAAHGVETLDLSGQPRPADIRVADLDHLAVVLASELAYLAQRSGVRPRSLPRGEFRTPRDLSPAHLHRLAEVLEAQLRWLARPG